MVPRSEGLSDRSVWSHGKSSDREASLQRVRRRLRLRTRALQARQITGVTHRRHVETACMYLDNITLTTASFLLQQYQCRVAALEREIKIYGNFQLFSRIREEKPHVMKKLVPVIGDICYDNLDIDEKVLEKLNEEVSKTRF